MSTGLEIIEYELFPYSPNHGLRHQISLLVRTMEPKLSLILWEKTTTTKKICQEKQNKNAKEQESKKGRINKYICRDIFI